jgi:hypothetical protein
VAFHGRLARARRSSTQLDLQPTVWGREESKTERMARGFSPDSSRSLGRHLCRVASVRSFSIPRELVVAPHDGPSIEVWCRVEQGSSGHPPRLEGCAWVASPRLGDGGCKWGKVMA